jgi:DNA-3-methyladenine glycosylase I
MKQRCPWAQVNDREIVYHDTEWGVPVHDDRLLFEFLMQATGMVNDHLVTCFRYREIQC